MVGINGKILNFMDCTYKSQNCARSQQHFAQLHDGETVTFRNFGSRLIKMIIIAKQYMLLFVIYIHQVWQIFVFVFANISLNICMNNRLTPFSSLSLFRYNDRQVFFQTVISSCPALSFPQRKIPWMYGTL